MLLKYLFKCILQKKTEKHEIFVLARTNRQLNELSFLMKKNQQHGEIRTHASPNLFQGYRYRFSFKGNML